MHVTRTLIRLIFLMSACERLNSAVFQICSFIVPKKQSLDMIAFLFITPSLLLSSLFSIILYSILHLFKSYRYMFAIYRASFMIIIIYFPLYVCAKYLLLLNIIIILLSYLIIVNIFTIHFCLNMVIVTLLLLCHFVYYILIIKTDNSFTIFSMGDFLFIFIIIIFVN